MTPLFTFQSPGVGNVEVFSDYDLSETFIRHTKAALAASGYNLLSSSNAYTIKNHPDKHNKTPVKKRKREARHIQRFE